jgi:hypothetical protein
MVCNFVNPMKTFSTPISRNLEWVFLDSWPRESVLIGMPFHYDHVSNIALSTPMSSLVCRTKFLALAMTNERDDKQAFVIQSMLETMANACDHQPKLDSGRCSRHWTTLANSMAKHGHVAPGYHHGHISERYSNRKVRLVGPLRMGPGSQCSARRPTDHYFPAQDLCPKSGNVVLRHVKLPSQELSTACTGQTKTNSMR